MTVRNLKVALVGCGQIADAHLQEIRKISGIEIVGVCDRFLPLAEQAAARFEIKGIFSDLTSMLEATKPQVLHITTPPHTHRGIAMTAFAAGAHAYIEKPFAIDVVEAEEIISAAQTAGLKICVGHDQLYDPIWQAFHKMHDRGDVGKIVHVESILGYDLSGPFGQVLAAEPNHWVHRLPGGLFQNTISHPLYKMTDFLCDESPQITASWRDLHQVGYPTDLRAMLWGSDVTGSLLFTTLARPLQRVVRLFGTRQTVEVDFDGQVLRCCRQGAMPGALAKMEVPYRQLREAGRSLAKNIGRFIASDIHYFAGMRVLFEKFYSSIIEGAPLPVPPKDIVRVTRIMDRIFEKCRRADSETANNGGLRDFHESTSQNVKQAGKACLLGDLA